MFSIVATETSLLTFMSLPGIGFRGDNLFFLQLAIGYIIGRIFSAYFLIPMYFKSNVISIYELIGNKFGLIIQKLASFIFLITRLLADGVRFLLTAIVIQQILGLSIEIIADYQKTVFRRNIENKDKFITTGLWSLSRHPNYFGEILLWTGVAVMSISSLQGLQYITLISPIFVYILLVYISGIRILEHQAKKKWGHLDSFKKYIKNIFNCCKTKTDHHSINNTIHRFIKVWFIK